MKHECCSCGSIINDNELIRRYPNITHLTERIDVGGVVPSGECPKCGALTYQVSKLVTYYSTHTVTTVCTHKIKIQAKTYEEAKELNNNYQANGYSPNVRLVHSNEEIKSYTATDPMEKSRL